MTLLASLQAITTALQAIPAAVTAAMSALQGLATFLKSDI